MSNSPKVTVTLSRWLARKESAQGGLAFASPIMEGRIEKETEKGILFEGSALVRESRFCWRCGREITNPVSQLAGYGPTCSELLGIPRDYTREDLERIKEEVRKRTTWKGWLPKSQVTIGRGQEEPRPQTAESGKETDGGQVRQFDIPW